jgi:hypothetical protein
MKNLFILLPVVLTCFACSSSYTVTKVSDSNRHTLKGLRFYLPVPYLLVAEKNLLIDGLKTVKQDSKGTTTSTEKMAIARKELQCSVIYLPDPRQEYSIITPAGQTAIKLENGWKLTGINNLKSTELVTPRQLQLLSGTKGLEPGLYALVYKRGRPILRKVDILP